MRLSARVFLLATFAGLCVATSRADAAPGFAPAPSAVSASGPRFAPARPSSRFGHARHGRAGFYGGGYSGFYGSPGEQRIVVVLPEASEPPPQKEPSIPVAIGIPRPPAADPVLYRIETQKGRPVVRIMRFSSDGYVVRR